MNLNNPVESKKIIVLSGLKLFTKQADLLTDSDIYNFLIQYYSIFEKDIPYLEGSIIKFMGDSCLAVFEPNNIKSVFDGLKDLKDKIDQWLLNTDFNKSHSCFKCHIGTVISGKLCSNNLDDITGKSVNHLFKMKGDDFLISDSLQNELSTLL